MAGRGIKFPCQPLFFVKNAWSCFSSKNCCKILKDSDKRYYKVRFEMYSVDCSFKFFELIYNKNVRMKEICRTSVA